MTLDFKTSIQEMLGLTRTQRLMEATHKIQNNLRRAHKGSTLIPEQPTQSKYPGKIARPLAQVVQTLQKMKHLGKVGRSFRPTEPEVIEGAEFLTRSFTCTAGSRSYKLYVPRHQTDSKRPLLIMLHGCNQSPSDFAAGTKMNELAETHGMLVAYPAQSQSANPSACWNWFNPSHQIHGMGEPAIIAGITIEIIRSYDIAANKVFVAGLSAGGAMAVVMGETYPQIFSAVGVHSGLPYKSANDIISAFAAMRGESHYKHVKPRLRTIVFHGDADGTVAHSNARTIVSDTHSKAVEHHLSHNGRQFTRRIVKDQNGTHFSEHWLVQGAGHAWSGGNAVGSYTDPTGPDASSEMVRFFLEGKKFPRLERFKSYGTS
jgi:poly(hydroxyalkanoate) depolymerase family esterase